MEVRTVVISAEIASCISKKAFSSPFAYNRQWQTEPDLHKMTQASSSFQVSQRFQNSKTESVERGDVCVTLRVPWRGLSFLYFCASEMTRWSTQPCTDGLEEQSNSLKQELQRNHLKHQDSGATFFFLFFCNFRIQRFPPIQQICGRAAERADFTV